MLPFSTRYLAFGTDDTYRVTALVNNMRVAQRYKPLGRKIGFTNRRMWDEYGIMVAHIQGPPASVRYQDALKTPRKLLPKRRGHADTRICASSRDGCCGVRSRQA